MRTWPPASRVAAAAGARVSLRATSPPAAFQAWKPPATWATRARPMSCSAAVASAERQPDWQYSTKRRSCPNTGLKYGLSGSAQNSSIPRGAWNAPGTRPSRSSSRTSRMSTNCTSGSPSSALASSTGIVVMRALASSTSCLMPFFTAMGTVLGCDAWSRNSWARERRAKQVALRHQRQLARIHGSRSVRDFRLDQQGQELQRFLPAGVAEINRDRFGQAFLADAQHGAHGAGFEGDGHLHLAGQARVLERVGVADALALDQLDVAAAESVAGAGGEVGERHPVAAAHAHVALVDHAGEAVRRRPLRHRRRIDEGAVHALGRRAQHAVQGDGAGVVLRVGHARSPGWVCRDPTNGAAGN